MKLYFIKELGLFFLMYFGRSVLEIKSLKFPAPLKLKVELSSGTLVYPT